MIREPGSKDDTLDPDDEPFPEREAEIRRLRAIILDAIEAVEPPYSHVVLTLGRDGGGSIEVELGVRTGPIPWMGARIVIAAKQD